MIAVAPFVAASMPEVAFRAVVAVAIAVVTTSISLRLLGARRGGAPAPPARLLGWGTAGFLALALNRWDWGADGLAVHTLAIAVPTTMAIAVGMDLLARPGSPAIGGQARPLDA